MKNLKQIINEKLVINKNSKVKQIKPLTLDDITKKYNLELTNTLQNCKLSGRYEYKLTKDIKNRFNSLLNSSEDELKKLSNDINDFIINQLKYNEENLYIGVRINHALNKPYICIRNNDDTTNNKRDSVYMEISAIILNGNYKFVIEIYNSEKQKFDKYENIICNVFNYIMENK